MAGTPPHVRLHELVAEEPPASGPGCPAECGLTLPPWVAVRVVAVCDALPGTATPPCFPERPPAPEVSALVPKAEDSGGCFLWPVGGSALLRAFCVLSDTVPVPLPVRDTSLEVLRVPNLFLSPPPHCFSLRRVVLPPSGSASCCGSLLPALSLVSYRRSWHRPGKAACEGASPRLLPSVASHFVTRVPFSLLFSLEKKKSVFCSLVGSGLTFLFCLLL